MAGSNTAKEIEANVTIGGSDVHPTRLSLSCTINGMAQASVSYIHKGEDADDSATDVTSQDIFTAMGKRQEKSFKVSSPDTDINLSSDSGGSIQFSGATSAPEYGFSISDVELTELIQPEYAAINSFDLSCYPLTGFDIDLVKAEIPDTIPECIIEIVDDIMEKGEKSFDKLKGLAKDSVERQHKINQQVKKYVTQLFEASTDTMGWEDVISTIKKTGGTAALTTRLYTILRSRSNGFFNIIMQLAEEFQCVYIPEFDKIGKLINKRKLYEDKQGIEIKAISLSARCGSLGMFPIRGVAVVGLKAGGDIDLVEDPAMNYVMYPKEVEPGGSVLQVQGPAWIPQNLYKSEVEAVNNGSGGTENPQTQGLSKASAKNSKKVKKQIEQNDTKKHSILEDWAKMEYYWQALGQSFVMISGELDMNAKVGTHYEVSGEKGKIFSGILTDVTHSVATSYDSADATTTYEFTHVIMGDASIPGIE